MSRTVLRRLAVGRAAARTRVIHRRQRQVKGAEQVKLRSACLAGGAIPSLFRRDWAPKVEVVDAVLHLLRFEGHEVLGVGRVLATCRSPSQAPRANPKRCHIKCIFCAALSAGMHATEGKETGESRIPRQNNYGSCADRDVIQYQVLSQRVLLRSPGGGA